MCKYCENGENNKNCPVCGRKLAEVVDSEFGAIRNE